MTRMLAIALAGLCLGANPASAQYGFASGFGGFSYRSYSHFSFGGPGLHFSSYYQSGFYAAPVGPLCYSYYWVPAYGPGYGPGFGNPFFLPQPPYFGPILPVANHVPVNPEPGLLRNANVLPTDARKGEFLVITPKGSSTTFTGGPGTISPMVDRVAPPPLRPVPPAFRFEPKADRGFGKTDAPEPDPKAEVSRQLKRAREAFSRGEYGQAVEHLDRALRAKPDDAAAAFLKGQSQFAAGQYAEAVATIQDALKRTPNWPTSDFKPKDLYGKPEQFEAQLADLRKAIAANPNQLALQFLLAYQLWFTGETAEAKILFADLASRLTDSTAIEPFLRK